MARNTREKLRSARQIIFHRRQKRASMGGKREKGLSARGTGVSPDQTGEKSLLIRTVEKQERA